MPIEMPPFAELFLGVGVLATLVGSWRLYQVRSLGELWQDRMRWTLSCAALMTYFCLFFFLWRRAPESTYLLGNVFAFAGTGIAYVLSFNRGVAVLATFLGRKDVAFESRVFGTGNIGLLLLPFACIVVYIIGMAVSQKSDPLSELRFLLGRANLLIAAQRAALELVDRDLQLIFQKLSCRAGCVQVVISQQVSIEVGPLEQVPLLVVVSDQGDVLLGRHWQNVMFFQYDNYSSVIFARPSYTSVNRRMGCFGMTPS